MFPAFAVLPIVAERSPTGRLAIGVRLPRASTTLRERDLKYSSFRLRWAAALKPACGETVMIHGNWWRLELSAIRRKGLRPVTAASHRESLIFYRATNSPLGFRSFREERDTRGDGILG